MAVSFYASLAQLPSETGCSHATEESIHEKDNGNTEEVQDPVATGEVHEAAITKEALSESGDNAEAASSSTTTTAATATEQRREPSAFNSFYAAMAPRKSGGQTVYRFAPQVAAEAEKTAAAAEAADGLEMQAHKHKSTWHAALNKRIIGQCSADGILGMAEELLSGGFDLQNTVTSISCVSQAKGGPKFRNDPRFLELLFRLEVLWDPVAFCVPQVEREEVAPHHYASVAAALARMQPSRRDGTIQRLLRTVAAHAAAAAPAAQPMDLTLLAWAFATLVQAPKQLIPALAREATQKIADFNAMHVSITTWAFAKLEVRYDPWITAMAEEVLVRLEGLTPQHISNIAWALGTLMIKSDCRIGVNCVRVMRALAAEAAERVDEFDAQALSNVAWALSHLGMVHEGYMCRLAEAAPAKLRNFPPLDITNMIWAFAKMGLKCPELLRTLRMDTLRRMPEFSAGELARVTWSLRLLGALDVDWLDAASRRFVECCGAKPPPEGWAALHMANCAAPFRARLPVWRAVERHFREEVYAPMLRELCAIKGAAQETEVESAVDRAQSLVRRLDVDFLGPNYTRPLLHDLGFADPDDPLASNPFSSDWPLPGQPGAGTVARPPWSACARAAATAVVNEFKAQLTEATQAFDRFGPHERRVVAWYAYELELRVPGHVVALREEGRVACFIEDEQRALCRRGEGTLERLAVGGSGPAAAAAVASGLLGLEDVKRAQRWLPGLFAQHARLAHCERQALLEVLLAVVAAARGVGVEVEDGTFDGGVGLAGELRMYVAHFCCVSCLSVMCHFVRRAPRVRLRVDFDDCWETRALDT